MELAKIVSKIISTSVSHSSKSYIHFKDLMDIPKESEMRSYPDGSRYFDDLINVVCTTTSEKGLYTAYCNSLLNPNTSGVRAKFDNGMLTSFHRHNYVELACVVEGRLGQRITDRDEVFNKGEICLIDKDSVHADYLFCENAVIVFLGISNSFFDKSIKLEVSDKKVFDFLTNVIINRREKYRFIRFIPRNKDSKAAYLIGQILMELQNPKAGSLYLVIGYIERLLSTLPDEYGITINKDDRAAAKRQIFADIQRYMNEHYQDLSIEDLCKVFDYNADYFNRLIKLHTGMTYSKFLQSIRLEKAECLLKSTSYPVEDIARQVGYHNLGYFYRIFFEKCQKTPRHIRQAP
jgi:AraC-like DNA-binding protein